MKDESDRPVPARGPADRRRRYRRHELALADGGRLVLRGDGTIELRGADGVATQAWAPDDGGWPDQAIRFGLRPETRTVRPDGHRGKGPNPPAN
jgi:hypothetical protein